MAGTCMRSRFHESAISHWPKPLIKTRYGSHRISLGYSLYRLHRVAEAKKSYLKALEIDKDFTPALKSLAYLSEELHEYNYADMYMRHAISMTTSVPDKQKLQVWLEEAEARRKMSK